MEGILLKHELFIFSSSILSDSQYLLKNSDILFGNEYEREFKFSQATDNKLFLVRWDE